MTRDTQLGIVEMGASARGEIAMLCSIAMPNYGIITNIGRAHLEGFGSPEGVREGKGELFDYLQTTLGTAFFAEGDETLAAMERSRKELPSVPYPWYELGEPSEGFITVKYRGEAIATHLVGDYNRYNVSAAIAIGEYFGVARRKIAEAIAAYAPDNKRSQRIDTGRNTVVADCYNANPSSMRAAVENFAQETSPLPKVVILGDMLELGEYAPAEHSDIVRLAAESGFAKVFLVGENFCQAATALSVGATEALCFPSTEKLLAALDAHPITGHVILLKGSHGISLEKTIEYL